MASALQDIRLQIVIDVKNQQSLKTLERSLQTMRSSTDNVSQAFTRQKSVMHPLAESWRQMTANLTLTEKAMDAVWRASSHLEEMGRRLLDVSRQLIDLGMGIVDTYADYDYWLRRAAVALNTNAHWQHELDLAIQDTAVAIGLYSPEEVAEAYNIWGAATGVVVDNQETLAQVTAAVQHVMIATAGAGGTLETNLKGVSAILGLFNLQASDAAHVTEVLALMTERTQADFGDLISSFTYMGPQAEAMSISFEQVAMMLGIVADNGQRGSRAGRGLSMVIEGLTTPTEEVKNALSEMTLATEGVAKTWDEIVFPEGEFAGMESIIYDLARTMYYANDQERAYFISKGLTNNAIRAFLPLIQDTVEMWENDATAMDRHVTALDKQKYSLENAGMFFEGMTTQMLGSIKAIIGSFKNSFFPILQMVAMKIMELATPVLDKLKVSLERATEWLKENPGVVDFIVKIGVAIAVVAGLAGALFALVGTILGLVTAFVMFVSTVLPLVGIFGLLFGIVARFTKAIVDNTGNIRGAFAKLGEAVMGLIDRIVGPVEELKNQLQPIFESFNEGFDQFVTVLAGAITRVAEALDKLTPEQVETIRKILAALGFLVGLRVFLAITAGSIGLLTSAIGGLASMIGGSLGSIMTIMKLLGITRLAAAVFGFVAAIVGSGGIIAALTALATNPVVLAIVGIVAAVAAMFAAYENNWGGFRDFVDGIIAWIDENLPPLEEIIGGVVKALGEFAAEVAIWWNETLMPALNDFVAWVVETFGPLAEQIFATLVAILTFIGNFFEDNKEMIAAFVVVIGGILTTLWNIFQNIFSAILDTVKNIIEDIVQIIGGALQWIEGVFQVFSALLTGDWDLLWEGIGNIISGAWEFIIGIIQLAIDVVASIFKTGLAIITGIFETIFGMEPGSIMHAINGFINDIIEFAGDVIDGFVNGIGDAIGGAIRSITGFFGDIVNGIKGFLGIKSPSTLLAGIGGDIVRGLWNGIVALKNWILNSIIGFVKAILPDPIEDILGIHSPSTLMAEYGKNVIQGLAVGIENTDDAYDAMRETTNRLASIAQSGVDHIGIATDFGLTGSTNERVIRLEVEVTSPDGSVDGVDVAKLADLITGSEMVRALEHMATVD